MAKPKRKKSPSPKKKGPAKKKAASPRKKHVSHKKPTRRKPVKKPALKPETLTAKEKAQVLKTGVTADLITHVPGHLLHAPPRPVSVSERAPGLIQMAAAIDQFNLLVGYILSWLSLVMVLLMTLVVALRYLFSVSYVWHSELVLYCHATLFMGAAGYTLLREGHVRVDVFYQHFSEKTKAYVNLFGSGIFLFPSCLALIYFSDDFIQRSWHLKEGSTEYGGLAGVFYIKSLIWVFAGVIMLQGIALCARAIETLKRIWRHG
jgi:TRAP-type mannitol/chloroaromatic compound transport system permease small subunit